MNYPFDRPRELRFAELGLSRTRETAALATALVVGLVGIAPAVAWVLSWFGILAPVPILAGVAIVGALYGLFALLVDRVPLGLLVALVVTATFAADFPLATGVDPYPGSLGPELWLVHLPLLALAGLLAIRGEFTIESIARAEYALAAFVLWSVVVAFVGRVPRLDTALYYALFSFVSLLAFGVASRSVDAELVEFRGVLATFLIAVGGHVAFAAAQLANQGLFGLSMLGETVRATSRNVVSVGPVGEFHIGVFVSGLTGGNGPLSVLIVLALPVALAFAVRRRGRHRTAVLLGVIAMAATLRFTAKDAARGAALVGIALFGAFLLWEHRDRLARLDVSLRRLGRSAVLSTVPLCALFVPSTIVANSNGGGSGEGGPSGGGGGAGGDAGGVVSGAPATIDGMRVSIPFFNLNTLGVRIQQYAVALDIFAEHPLFGVGGANFQYIAATYDVPAIKGLALHSLYLSLLVGTGIPGFVLYVLSLLLVLWCGWRFLQSRTADRPLVAGVLAGLVGYLAVVFWTLPIRFTYAVPFWLLAGALVGQERLSSGAR